MGQVALLHRSHVDHLSFSGVILPDLPAADRSPVRFSALGGITSYPEPCPVSTGGYATGDSENR